MGPRARQRHGDGPRHGREARSGFPIVPIESGRAASLRTPRLLLRPLRPEDDDALVALHSHPDVWPVFGDSPTAAAAGARRFLDAFTGRDPERGEAPWAVEAGDEVLDHQGRQSTGLVGVVGLWPVRIDPPFAHRARPCVTIGWRLAPSWWGRGLVTEAAATCLAHARDELRLPEVVSFTSAGNHRSISVMVRLGMVPDPDAGFEHPHVAPGDARRRHVVYRTNWAPRRVELL